MAKDNFVLISKRPASAELLELYVGDRTEQTPSREQLESLYLYVTALEHSNIKLQDLISNLERQLTSVTQQSA